MPGCSALVQKALEVSWSELWLERPWFRFRELTKTDCLTSVVTGRLLIFTINMIFLMPEVNLNPVRRIEITAALLRTFILLCGKQLLHMPGFRHLPGVITEVHLQAISGIKQLAIMSLANGRPVCPAAWASPWRPGPNRSLAHP